MRSCDDTIELAAEAGLRSLFVGFETLSPDSLHGAGKKQNLGRDYRAVVKRLDDHITQIDVHAAHLTSRYLLVWGAADYPSRPFWDGMLLHVRASPLSPNRPSTREPTLMGHCVSQWLVISG